MQRSFKRKLQATILQKIHCHSIKSTGLVSNIGFGWYLNKSGAWERLIKAFAQNKPILVDESGETEKQYARFVPLYARGSMGLTHGRRHLSLIYPLQEKQGQRLYLNDPNLKKPHIIQSGAIMSNPILGTNPEEQPIRQAIIIHSWPEIPGWLRKETDKRWPPVNQFAKNLFDKVSP